MIKKSKKESKLKTMKNYREKNMLGEDRKKN